MSPDGQRGVRGNGRTARQLLFNSRPCVASENAAHGSTRRKLAAGVTRKDRAPVLPARDRRAGADGKLLIVAPALFRYTDAQNPSPAFQWPAWMFYDLYVRGFSSIHRSTDMGTSQHSFALPNGHIVLFEALPDVSPSAYTVKIIDGEKTLSVTCSCNGVSKNCANGTSVSCDCTKNPPVLSCN